MSQPEQGLTSLRRHNQMAEKFWAMNEQNSSDTFFRKRLLRAASRFCARRLRTCT